MAKTVNKVKKQKERKKTDQKQEIKNALIKKALGYCQDEIVEEYVCDTEGEIKLVKRKVAKKFVPPDISAVKILLAEFEEKNNLTTLTKEELEAEKKRLLKELYELEDE